MSTMHYNKYREYRKTIPEVLMTATVRRVYTTEDS